MQTSRLRWSIYYLLLLPVNGWFCFSLLADRFSYTTANNINIYDQALPCISPSLENIKNIRNNLNHSVEYFFTTLFHNSLINLMIQERVLKKQSISNSMIYDTLFYDLRYHEDQQEWFLTHQHDHRTVSLLLREHPYPQKKLICQQLSFLAEHQDVLLNARMKIINV